MTLEIFEDVKFYNAVKKLNTKRIKKTALSYSKKGEIFFFLQVAEAQIDLFFECHQDINGY